MVGRKPSTGSRAGLGEPWNTDLKAFCGAMVGLDQRNVLRAAVTAYITQFIALNEGVRLEYERLRAELLKAGSDGKVTALKTNLTAK